jgi:toxin FitB
MKFLVDANVISELREPARTNPGVQQWARSVQIDDLATSVICLMELERGIARIEPRDPRFHERLDNWLRLVVLPQYSGRILDVDMSVASRCAKLFATRTAPVADALIAATALVHGLTMVTRNERDFAPLGVPLLNPWSD